MTALIVVVLSLGLSLIYLAGAGVVFIRVLRSRRLALCSGCRGEKENYYGQNLIRHHAHESAFWQAASASLLWPVALVVVIPAIYADPHRGQLREEALQRRIRELEREAGIAS